MPILVWTQKVWFQSTGPPPTQWYTKTGCKGYETCSTNCRQHFVLCTSCGHDGPNGTLLRCHQANKGNWKNNRKMHTIAWLPCHQWNNEDKMSRFRNDFEYSFWCILPLRSWSPQQSMWTFCHGMDAKSQQTDTVKWCVPHKLSHHEICGGVHCRSQTQQFIPQLPDWNDFLTNIGQPWSPATQNTRLLQ